MNTTPVSAYITQLTKYERYWLVPLACVFILLAEFSRYLTAWRIGEIVFAPRNFFVVGVVTLVLWKFFQFFPKRQRARLGMWQLLIVPVVLLAWLLLSTVLSNYPNATPIGLEWLNGVTLLLLVGLAARPVAGSKWVATSLVVAVLVIVVIGLVEKITDTHLPLSNLHNPFRQQWAITSVFIGQNHLAASLGLLLPVVAGFALAWQGWRRWLSLATVAGGLVAIFFTGSSLALVAVVLAAAVFAAVGLIRSTGRVKQRVLVAIIAAVVVVGVGWFVLPASVQERVSFATVGVRQSFEARTELIKEGIALLGQNAWRGLGPGATDQLVEVSVGSQPTLRALHNLSLEFAVTFGLVASVVGLAWLLWVVVRVVRRLAGPGQRWPTTGVLASLLALVIVQAVPSTFEGVRAPFIVIGFALALAMRCVR